MKRITCETCGSNDIIKQEGYYICQSCLTKYTPEEAKKLLVEGTVKIDNSDRVVKWLELGRRAIEGDDYLSAEKYYTLVLEEVPDNWEAFFLVYIAEHVNVQSEKSALLPIYSQTTLTQYFHY